ncbi:MAG: Hpt domain-containing protein, partial [Xanthobacteraceae bacterium]
MDDLLREFLTETNENLERVDAEIVRFEHESNNSEILGNIFRLVHTIKGTCGFLGLPRLEALAHATETLMSRFRDGMPVTSDAVTLVLSAIDRIKIILDEIEEKQGEEGGDDSDLIERLRHSAEHARTRSSPAPEAPNGAQVRSPSRVPAEAKALAREKDAPRDERERAANYSIRVQVETLDNLMTRVSELVLTRNQLLEIVRRHEESDFNVPLQRLSNVTAELQEGVMKTRMQPIGNAWQKLPRIVRDLCTELGKDIELEMRGANTELDRQVLEMVKDPLTHLVRN